MHRAPTRRYSSRTIRAYKLMRLSEINLVRCVLDTTRTTHDNRTLKNKIITIKYKINNRFRSVRAILYHIRISIRVRTAVTVNLAYTTCRYVRIVSHDRHRLTS